MTRAAKFLYRLAITPMMITAFAAHAQPLPANKERALKPADSFRECDACPDMVVVPAGAFTMDMSPGEKGKPLSDQQRKVTFARPFAVGKFAVTFAEWDACVADGGCNGYRPDDWTWGRGKQPVINVSWDDAKTYVAWLARKTGKPYRLLSEAEREYVTRAGTSTPYWWGEKISPEQANYKAESFVLYSKQRTQPVDAFKPNPWGLYQVHGNVYDWLEDCWNDSYRGAPADGSARTSGDCMRHVIRGGCYDDYPESLKSAARGWAGPPKRRMTLVGFRVARDLK